MKSTILGENDRVSHISSPPTDLEIADINFIRHQVLFAFKYLLVSQY